MSYPQLADQSVVPVHSEHWQSHFCLTGGSVDCPIKKRRERWLKEHQNVDLLDSHKHNHEYQNSFIVFIYTYLLYFLSVPCEALASLDTFEPTSQYCHNLYQLSQFTLDSLSSLPAPDPLHSIYIIHSKWHPSVIVFACVELCVCLRKANYSQPKWYKYSCDPDLCFPLLRLFLWDNFGLHWVDMCCNECKPDVCHFHWLTKTI